MLKDNKMKSTLKIDYSSRPNGGRPVIKIVQPIELLKAENYAEDVDVRDVMIRDYLHTPCMSDRNGLFRVSSHFETPHGNNPTHYITNIDVVPEEEMFYTFRHAILNRLIPYNTLLSMDREEPKKPDDTSCSTRFERELEAKKINEFFDWVEQTGYCSWEERQPK